MTDGNRPDPPDDFIIGGESSGVPPTFTPGQRAAGYRDAPVIGTNDNPAGGWESRAQSDSSEAGDEFGVIGYADPDAPYDEYYDDDYYDEPPARQPLFYVFIGLAILLGALLVFLLFRLLSGDSSPAADNDPDFNISIDSPLNDERINAGDDVPVRVRANATEPIRTLQLIFEGQVVDEAVFESIPDDGIYSATLTFTVAEPGTYQISARAVSESGAARSGQPVTVIAVERIDNRPSRITGEVISTVNARQGPGDQFTAVRTINAGQIVTVLGRTRDSQWLLLDDDTWIRRAAVQLSDSVDLVDVVQPTPTLSPPTNTPEPSSTPSPSPESDTPDFSPVDATLDSGGSVLRVTIANLSTQEYQGPLVVRVTGIGANALEQVFSVSLGANSTQAVEFSLPQSQSTGVTVQVSVDAAGQVPELTEDNNSASFLLAPPVANPELVITDATILDSTLRVTVMNVGSDMPPSDVVVTVALGGEVNTASLAGLSLAFGDSRVFTLTRPAGSGTASITVTVGGQELASGSIEIPGAPTPEPTATSTP